MADALTARQTYEKALTIGETKATMPLARSFVLAVLAGAFIGLGGMMLLLVKADSTLSLAISNLLSGLAFSIGLFAVVVAGGELFTGNSLMVLGMADGRYGWGDLLRSWGVVYAGNLLGSFVVATLLHLSGFAGLGNGAVGGAIASVATVKCSLPVFQTVFKGVMCNLLVCLGVWMSFASRSVTDKFLATAIPVVAFVACGYEHCVANMMLLPLAMMEVTGASAVSLGSVLCNLLLVTVGNLIGGAVLLAGSYWLAFGWDGKVGGRELSDVLGGGRDDDDKDDGTDRDE